MEEKESSKRRNKPGFGENWSPLAPVRALGACFAEFHLNFIVDDTVLEASSGCPAVPWRALVSRMARVTIQTRPVAASKALLWPRGTRSDGFAATYASKQPTPRT